MSSSKETKPTHPYYKELCQLGETFIELLKSRPEDQSISTLRSHAVFYRGKQNQRSKLAIEALPTVKSPPKNEKCQICLKEFVSGGKEMKEMKCKHLFHKKCVIDKVLGAKAVATCPVCEVKVPVRGDKLLGEDMDWDRLDDAFFQKIQGYVRGGGGGSSA